MLLPPSLHISKSMSFLLLICQLSGFFILPIIKTSEAGCFHSYKYHFSTPVVRDSSWDVEVWRCGLLGWWHTEYQATAPPEKNMHGTLTSITTGWARQGSEGSGARHLGY